jgi:DNA-binding transcriptional LysR family regulator
MELRQLEYFVAVARHRNFTRAAEELYVTQPALSQQVRRLEAELGLALLSRTPSGVELTPAGADLFERAESILGEVARARAELDQHAGVERGIVRVAAPAGDALGLAQALADFHAEHPGIGLALRQGSVDEAIGLVQRGGADIAVVSLPDGRADQGVVAEPLESEEMVLAVPADSDLVGPVSLWDLRDRSFILAERGTAVREAVLEACQAAGFSPVPRFEVGEPATVRFLVHSGLGVAVVPPSWLTPPGPQVVALQLADPAPCYRLSLLAPAAGLSPAAALLHERLLRGSRPAQP